MKRIKKASVLDGVEVLKDSSFFVEEFFNTGIPVMNVAFSAKIDGGFSRGINILAGESKTAKTLFMHMCAKQFLDQHDDGVYIFFDCEHGSNKNTFESVDLDTSRVIHVPIEHVEQLKIQTHKYLEELTKEDNVIIGVDSFGEIASLKEIEDVDKGKTTEDMSRAKKLNSFFRMFKPVLNTKNIPLIGIGKTYQTQETYSKAVLGGGQGITKQSDSIFFITKSQYKEGADKVGTSFNITINKGRLVAENSKFSIVIYNDGRGLYKHSSIFDIGQELGFIERSGRTYTIDSIGESGFRKKLDTDEYMERLCQVDEFKEAVTEAYKLGTLHTNSDEEVAIEEAPSEGNTF